MKKDEALSTAFMITAETEELQKMLGDDPTPETLEYATKRLAELKVTFDEVKKELARIKRETGIRKFVSFMLYFLFASAFIYSFRLDWPLNIAVLGGGFVLFLIGNRVWDALERL